MRHGIYVVSKVRHAEVWKGLRDRGFPIMSSWIDDGLEHEIDFSEAWPRYLSEAGQATYAIVFATEGEVLKGGLLEAGAALANGAHVFVVGDVPQLRTVRYHPRLKPATSIQHATSMIADMVGVRIGSRLQGDIAHWVERVFGSTCLFDMEERGKRVAEESIELFQALGLPREMLDKIVDHVYSRPVGVVEQEIAGVGTTIMSLSEAYGVSFDCEVAKELKRVEALPIEHFRNKRKEKVAAGISMVPSV
jgi:hypothetical protein